MKRPLKGHSSGRWRNATGAFSTANPKGFIAQEVHKRSAVPGSAAYRPRRVRPNQGQKFSTAFPKNDVDWKILAASQLPSPGQYKQVPAKVTRFTVGHSGKFNKSMPATDVDIAMRRSRQEPGPLEYTTSFKNVSQRLGGQKGRAFSSSVLPTFSDVHKNYTMANPGPGHCKCHYNSFYSRRRKLTFFCFFLSFLLLLCDFISIPGTSYDPMIPSSYNLICLDAQRRVERKRKSATGQISKAQVPGYIEVALRQSHANPSPLHYQRHGYDNAIRESQGSSKFSSAFPKNDVDWRIHVAKSLPAPGQYNPSLPFRSDVLHSSGANISRAVALSVALPVRPTKIIKCYDGELKIPMEIAELFTQSGVLRVVKSFLKRQVEKIVKMIDMFPFPNTTPMNRKASKLHLERVLCRYRKRYGSRRPSFVAPFAKLIGTMLQSDGQVERALAIMKSVTCAT